jgi:hypothetical protein
MMPYCPECGAEYERGMTRCPDCDRELMDDMDDIENLDDEGFFDEDTPPVLIYQTNDPVSAELLEEALKDQGIPCLVRADTGTYSGLGALTSVFKGTKIYVPESALNEAIEIAETVIPNYKKPEE